MATRYDKLQPTFCAALHPVAALLIVRNSGTRPNPPSMKSRIRQLLHASPFQPFIIRMADGKEYRIEHPDFVLAAASDAPQIAFEEPDGTMRFLSAVLAASVERVPAAAQSQAA
jgi:hypothetical protein